MNNLRELGDAFREAAGGGVLAVLLIIVVLLAAIVVKMMWPAIRARREARRRFDRFAVANHLSPEEIQTLHRLAAIKFPDTPLLIFVSPTGFDAAAAADGVQASDLRGKLFGAVAKSEIRNSKNNGNQK